MLRFIFLKDSCSKPRNILNTIEGLKRANKETGEGDKLEINKTDFMETKRDKQILVQTVKNNKE